MKSSTAAAAREVLEVANPLQLGTSGTTAAAGNDSRLSDARDPKAGSVTNASIASGAQIALSKLAVGNVSGQSNGAAASLVIWTGTEAQFQALGSKSASTVYFRTAA
ncbi:hypothetical protein CH289_07595 [Rhodococcus sp. RS1C4]|nr:hypothetical protein [Rhodococcus sp. RS1C4]OZC55049.1 hypothetical protein CH289_07595 [Rhodococcus sp. RS1C4]